MRREGVVQNGSKAVGDKNKHHQADNLRGWRSGYGDEEAGFGSEESGHGKIEATKPSSTTDYNGFTNVIVTHNGESENEILKKSMEKTTVDIA